MTGSPAEIVETPGDLAKALWECRGEVATVNVTRASSGRRDENTETAREGTK